MLGASLHDYHVFRHPCLLKSCLALAREWLVVYAYPAYSSKLRSCDLIGRKKLGLGNDGIGKDSIITSTDGVIWVIRCSDLF